MKKFFCVALVLVLILSSLAFADDELVGVLAQLNNSEEEYRSFVLDGRETLGFSFLSHGDEKFRYYDSLLTMQMALNAGEVGEVQLPEIVAEYFINANPSIYTVSCVSQVRPTYLAFGFLSSNTAMRDKFNDALKIISENGTLRKISQEYLENASEEKIKLENFDGGEKIKVALTGDLPPIDFVDEDGTPTGYNMAIISELAKVMKANIEVIDIDAGARSAVLASGRADVVLWYKVTRGIDNQPDVPENVILSEPYYEWNKFLHIKKK